MGILSRYFNQIKLQLIGLTVSQKLLIGALVVIMLGTIYFVVISSAKPDMVELLPQPSTPEEISKMEGFLKGRYEYQVSGDKILVPAEQRISILGELGAAQVLPQDITAAFAKLADANDYMLPDASIERRWNYARQEVLTKIIRSFPYVANATVMLSKGERAGLGRNNVPSSATVAVKLKSGDGLTSQQVMAIVELVRGAMSGLKREDVHITDGMRSYSAPSDDTPMPADLLAYKRAFEDDLNRKLQNQFASYGDVKTAVNVVVDMSHVEKKQEIFDPKGVVKAVVDETTHDSSGSDGGVASGQPGVASMTPMAVGGGGPGGGRSTTTDNETSTQSVPKFSSIVTATVTPPGTKFEKLTAAISLPRSYFVRKYQAQSKDPKAEPDDKAVQALFDEAVKSVRPLAASAIGADTDTQVQVAWYDDAIAPPTGPAVANAGSFLASTGGVGGLVGQYGKQALLGGVALGALMMMLMMVKRGAGRGQRAGSFGFPGRPGRSGRKETQRCRPEFRHRGGCDRRGQRRRGCAHRHRTRRRDPPEPQDGRRGLDDDQGKPRKRGEPGETLDHEGKVRLTTAQSGPR